MVGGSGSSSLARAPSSAALRGINGPDRISNRRHLRSVSSSRRAGARRVVVRADYRQYPDPSLIEDVKKSFPQEKGIATVEEARCLVSSLGYSFLDVRSPVELEDIGRVRGCVNVPLINTTKRWSSEHKRKVMVQQPNPDFLEQLKKKFPDKSSPILVACSDGRERAIQVLMIMEDEGYTGMVGLKGGFNAWFAVFDNKLNRRDYTECQTVFDADGDASGIHTTGAGFEKMDKIELPDLRDSTEWVDWKEEVGKVSAR